LDATYLGKSLFFGKQHPQSLPRYYLAALIALTLAPFLAVKLPGLGDTLNHLARMHILATIDRSLDLQRFYVVHWSPVPYLAMDAVVPVLARVMPLDWATKIFVSACVLMPFLGASALHYTVHRRFGLMPAAALLFGANTLLQLGFLNYLFMAGLACMAVALWIASTAWPRLPRTGLFMVLATLLYLGHAFAFLGYCCAVAGIEIAAAARVRFTPLRTIATNWLLAAAPAVPALCLAATLDTAPGTSGQLYAHYGDIGEKVLALLSPLLFTVGPVQSRVAGACLIIACILVPRLRLCPTLWPAALATGLAAAAMPEIVFSTWLMDFRLPLFTTILLTGGATLRLAPVARNALAAILAVALLIKSADVWRTLRATDAQIGEMRHLLTGLPRGARLLVANESGPPTGPGLTGSTIWTMPLLAVIDRDAFVPTLFTGLTTVHTRPGFAAVSTPQGSPTTLSRLSSDLAGAAPALTPVEQREGLKIYWHDWPENFDYLLVEHFYAAAPAMLPDHLRPAAHTQNLDLYKIAQ
jgi:hypothetical protein